MRVNGVHALVTLLAQQTALKGTSADRGIKLQVLNELLSETKDARQRIVMLERMLRDANIISDGENWMEPRAPGQKPEIPDLSHWKAASATLDAINKQKMEISGRTWESGEGEVRPDQRSREASAADDQPKQEARPFASQPSSATINPYAASAATFGLAEKFEPTLEDIEKALQTLGVPPLDPRLRRQIGEDFESDRKAMRDEKFRFLLIAAGFALVIGLVVILN